MFMLMPRQKSFLCFCTALAYIIESGSSFLLCNKLLPNNLPPKHVSKFLTQSRSCSSALYDVKTPSIIDTKPKLLPPGILGPPEPLGSLEVGQYVNAFRALQYDGSESSDKKLQFTIERVSRSPDVFCLRNFVTPSECTQIRNAAEESGMEEAGTVTEGDTSSRKRCSVAWLPSNNNNQSQDANTRSASQSIVSDLVSSTANIFLSKDVMSHPSAGVEDLQVLKYGTGGEFVHHHDGESRVLTVIYYINGVGGTWFPLADANHKNDDGSKDNFCDREPLNKAEALDLVKGLVPGRDGLLVKGTGNVQSSKGTTQHAKKGEENEHIVQVNQGDAIAFYNYKDDGFGELDWRSLHCGLPTTEEDGTKWIANHWYKLNALADL